MGHGTVRRRAMHAAPRPPRRRRRAPLLIVAASALAVGLIAGTAWSYVTASGSGTGLGKIGTTTTVTVTAATATASLLPAGTGAAYFTLKNTNPFVVTFTKLTGATIVSNTVTACPSANVSIVPTMPYTLPTAVTVAASTTSPTKSIPTLVKLAATAPTGCQGVTFTLTLTFTGKS